MLTEKIEDLLTSAIKTASGKKPKKISLEAPSNADFGDLTTNIAMTLSKELKKNPRELAQSIIDALPENELIKKSEIAGPGFINFWLTDEVFEQAFGELNKKIDQESYGKLSIGKGTVVTDSSHPNVAKPMGVHHLLSTIIGQAINNLFVTCNYKLIRDNYLGDWGTQFGKLTYAIRKWGNIEQIKKDPIPELLKIYVRFHEEAKKNPELEEEGRKEFKKLEDGDKENRELWQWICDISLEAFKNLWKRLGVEYDIMQGESYYEDKMPSIIEEGKKKGVIIEGEKGALIVPMIDENTPPCIIQKSDGATTYATRDLARIKDWRDHQKASQGIVIVDIAQKLHFVQVHESAQKLGLDLKHEAVHFGRMSFPEGGMSTRKGKVVLLENVLDEAEKRALEKIKSHNSELPEKEQVELARIIGIGAIKYNVLSQNRNKNYTFDWDVMLSFDGNSAPYLQYAYTRTQSVLRKAKDGAVIASRACPERNRIESKGKQSASQLRKPEEKTLLKNLLNFETVIQRSLEEYKPNTLCSYLFELAQAFSLFYNNLRIIDAETPEEQATRLKLTEDVAYVLKKGLDILGIEVPERM